jgi:enamine deaminase RidA (YjgF/YER057c/UK114 family)
MGHSSPMGARSAIGAGELPFGMPVEVEAVASVD